MSTEIKDIVGRGMDMAAEQGFVLAQLKIRGMIFKRIEWLREEVKRGGDYRYLDAHILNAHIHEASYLDEQIAEMKPNE